MSTVIAEEIAGFFRSVMCGVFLGAAYELVRWCSGGLFRRAWWHGLEDLLYWTLCALVLFSTIQEENGGTIRWYMLAGAAAGAGVYRWMLGPIVHRILTPLWTSLRKSLQFVEKLLKKGEKSVTLIDKVEDGAVGARKGGRHGQIRKKEKT